MIGDTLTRENLEAIRAAMIRIKQIDRSRYFEDYLREVDHRLEQCRKEEEFLQWQKEKEEKEAKEAQQVNKNSTTQN